MKTLFILALGLLLTSCSSIRPTLVVDPVTGELVLSASYRPEVSPEK